MKVTLVNPDLEFVLILTTRKQTNISAPTFGSKSVGSSRNSKVECDEKVSLDLG